MDQLLCMVWSVGWLIKNRAEVDWSNGVDGIRNGIRNECIWGINNVELIMNKIREDKLRWFRNIIRREILGAVRMVMEMNAEGKRLKKKSLHVIESYIRTSGVCK